MKIPVPRKFKASETRGAKAPPFEIPLAKIGVEAVIKPRETNEFIAAWTFCISRIIFNQRTRIPLPIDPVNAAQRNDGITFGDGFISENALFGIAEKSGRAAARAVKMKNHAAGAERKIRAGMLNR